MKMQLYIHLDPIYTYAYIYTYICISKIFQVVKAFESFSVPTTHEVHDPTSLP